MELRRNIGFAARVAAANLFNRSYPLSVTYITTYRCNFTCEYCDVWRFRDTELSTKEAVSMIDEFAGLGMRRLSFNGGEPLMRADIGELISHSRARGVFTTMFTNGTLVERNLNKLKPLDILVISLDGPEEVHDRQRMNGTHARVVSAIRAARKAGITVWTNTVITKDNLESLPQMVEEASSLGVRMIFQPVLSYSHSSDNSRIGALSCDRRVYEQVIERLKALKRSGAPIVHSTEYLDYIKVPVWGINKRKCWAGRLYCAVTPSGAVSPCYPVFNSRQWPDGRTLGYARAFATIGEFSCEGCYCALVESDFLYSLKAGPVVNLVRSMEAV